MASPVQHIVKWSPQDWRTSRVRTRSIVTGKPMLRLVYLEILNAIWESGGMVPHDVDVLQDLLAIPAADVAEHLPTLLEIGRKGRGGLRVEHVDGAPVLVNSRASEEIADDIAYRASQQEFGKKGGRPRKATLTDEQKEGVNGKGTITSEKGTLSDEKGTPSPPTPYPTPSPSPPPTPLPPPEEAPTELARSPAVSTPAARQKGSKPRAPADDDPIIMLFPVTGDPERREWPLRQSRLEQYLAAYPELDVQAALRKALLWLQTNTGRLKTAGGMPRYLGTWLRKAVDAGQDLRSPPRDSGGNGGGARSRRSTTWDDLDKHSRNLLRDCQAEDVMRCGGDRDLARERYPEHWPEGS